MEYDIIIIGAGPAGYVAAIRAGQLGMKTALIEKKQVGGMCMNWGCIPTKSIIESARALAKAKSAATFGVTGIEPEKLGLDWTVAKNRAMEIVGKLRGGVESVLKKNGVEVIHGAARINDSGSVTVSNKNLKTKNIFIATGSYPSATGTGLKKELWIQIEKLFELESLPKHLVIYGRGPVSVELAQFFAMAGSKVAIVATKGKFLPGIDNYLEQYVLKILKDQGVKVYFDLEIKGYEKGKLLAGDEKIACDRILNASWRKAVVPPSETEIPLDEEGYIVTNDSFETSIPGIFAIGDVNGRAYLAHVASAQGIWLVNHLKGIRSEFDFKNYPYNLYSTPEIAQIGSTEAQLTEQGILYKISEFPLSANGKAMAEGNTEGRIRILSEDRYGQVMGVQIIAEHATDMIAEAAAFMQIEGTVYDVAQTIHAHPTVSEVFMEAVRNDS
jgi:dihydrolipoamide dehydrogenase